MPPPMTHPTPLLAQVCLPVQGHCCRAGTWAARGEDNSISAWGVGQLAWSVCSGAAALIANCGCLLRVGCGWFGL